MVELYLQDGSRGRRQPHLVAHPDDPRFIAVASKAAGWLYDIAGPFFWGAIVMMFALGGVAPR